MIPLNLGRASLFGFPLPLTPHPQSLPLYHRHRHEQLTLHTAPILNNDFSTRSQTIHLPREAGERFDAVCATRVEFAFAYVPYFKLFILVNLPLPSEQPYVSISTVPCPQNKYLNILSYSSPPQTSPISVGPWIT